MEHCDIRTTLENAGLSKTVQREAVLSILIRADLPLSARDILIRIGRGCRINKVTVYRVLDSFRTAGIVREIPTEHGETFYEMACRHNPTHPHFYCRICRSLACLPSAGIEQKWPQCVRPGDAAIESIVINFTGLCKYCQKRSRTGSG